MKLFKKIKTIESEKEEKLLPYEKREAIKPLMMVVTIINRGQGEFFIDRYNEIGVALNLVLFSYSMPPEEYRSILGKDTTKKVVILSFCRKEYVEKMLKLAEERFKISQAAKGICFACPVNAVSGISVYKFIADQNQDLRRSENGK